MFQMRRLGSGLLLFMLVAGNVWAQDGGVKYVASDGGSDTNPGTEAAPYGSFPYAVMQLQSNDTLIVKNGNYGPLSVTCSAGTKTGITIRAQNPRLARFTGLKMTGCVDWTIEDLVILESYLGNGCAQVDSRATVRGNLFDITGNLQFGGAGSLIVRNEFRGTRGGAAAFDYLSMVQLVKGVVFRQNYITGDYYYGLLAYEGVSVIENNIIDGRFDYGIGVAIRANQSKLFGNLVKGQRGYVSASELAIPVENVVLQGNVIVGNGDSSLGFYFRYTRNMYLQNNTVQNTGAACSADSNGQSVSASNIGLLDFVRNDMQGDMTGTSHNVTVTDNNFVAIDGGRPVFTAFNMGTSSAFDPRRKGCYAYPPLDGGIYLADGGLLGAKLLYFSYDGGLSNQPMWNMAGGAAGGMFMACGAIYPGVNDDVSTPTNCRNAHTRFGVNEAACPLSDFYPALPDGGTQTDAGVDAGVFDAGLDAGRDAGSTDAGPDASVDGGGTIDAGIDAGNRDGGFADGGMDQPLLRFTSIPKPAFAICGTSYIYNVTTYPPEAVVDQPTPSPSTSVKDGAFRWNNPQPGPPQTFILRATHNGKSVTQTFEVPVQCDASSCGCQSTIQTSWLWFLALVLLAKRMKNH
jgi:hypothetical protein